MEIHVEWSGKRGKAEKTKLVTVSLRSTTNGFLNAKLKLFHIKRNKNNNMLKKKYPKYLRKKLSKT